MVKIAEISEDVNCQTNKFQQVLEVGGCGWWLMHSSPHTTFAGKEFELKLENLLNVFLVFFRQIVQAVLRKPVKGYLKNFFEGFIFLRQARKALTAEACIKCPKCINLIQLVLSWSIFSVPWHCASLLLSFKCVFDVVV